MYAQEHNKVNVTSAANLSNRFTPPAYQIFLCLVKLLLKRKANASHPSQEKAPQMVVNGTSFSISRWLFAIYDLRFGKFARGARIFLIRMSDDISQ